MACRVQLHGWHRCLRCKQLLFQDRGPQFRSRACVQVTSQLFSLSVCLLSYKLCTPLRVLFPPLCVLFPPLCVLPCQLFTALYILLAPLRIFPRKMLPALGFLPDQLIETSCAVSQTMQ